MVSCLKCEKPVPKIDDKNPKITCHGCERHICVKCSGLLATELRVVVLQAPTLKYLCPDCQLGVRQVPALRKLVSQMKEEIDALKNSQNQSTSLEAVISEISEREKRSKNIIMFGVPEHGHGVDGMDAEASKQHDLDQVNKVLGDIVESEAPAAIIRLGKQTGQAPRPVKLIFRSKSAAVRVLKNGRKLRNGVNVKNDLTPYQREYLLKLREELSERIKKGESNLTIKYVNNVPKIVKVNDTPKN